MFSLVSLFFFFLFSLVFFTSVARVALVSHSCCTCVTRVSLVLHSCCLCCTRITRVWHWLCKTDYIVSNRFEFTSDFMSACSYIHASADGTVGIFCWNLLCANFSLLNVELRDQLDVFNRLIEKWTEHDAPIIIQSQKSFWAYKRALQANFLERVKACNIKGIIVTVSLLINQLRFCWLYSLILANCIVSIKTF